MKYPSKRIIENYDRRRPINSNFYLAHQSLFNNNHKDLQFTHLQTRIITDWSTVKLGKWNQVLIAVCPKQHRENLQSIIREKENMQK